MQPSNAAIRQGRTIGREYRHHDVINQGLDQKCLVCFYVSLDLASVLFLLVRSGRKTDGHIINIRMFIKFFMFCFAIGKAFRVEEDVRDA